MILTKRALLLALLCFLPLIIAVVVAALDRFPGREERALKEDGSPPDAPAPSAQPKALAFQDASDAELHQHYNAIARCEREGNRPVMGFGFDVICVAKSSVAWVEESHAFAETAR